MPKISIFDHIYLTYFQELGVNAWQLDSVTQWVWFLPEGVIKLHFSQLLQAMPKFIANFRSKIASIQKFYPYA